MHSVVGQPIFLLLDRDPVGAVRQRDPAIPAGDPQPPLRVEDQIADEILSQPIVGARRRW